MHRLWWLIDVGLDLAVSFMKEANSSVRNGQIRIVSIFSCRLEHLHQPFEVSFEILIFGLAICPHLFLVVQFKLLLLEMTLVVAKLGNEIVSLLDLFLQVGYFVVIPIVRYP